MTRRLPYPGYTWSFTQHAAGIKAKVLYDFLKCAAPFEGEAGGYGDKITNLMSIDGVLTSNFREGRASSWRDYQQVLAELGLIYSTSICKALTLTDVAQFFLAGDIGFSELITIQSLRFQYPNGQKSTIQSRQKGLLSGLGLGVPDSNIELQQQYGVLIKPGVLILRILLELLRAGFDSEISDTECQLFLLPCKNNSEWSIAYAELVANRGRAHELEINEVAHARRNVQDWFKFLGESDLFERVGGSLKLSAYVKNNVKRVQSMCSYHESAGTWWIPQSSDNSARLSWFDWYGQMPYATQDFLRLNVDIDPAYAEENFVAGVDDDTDDVDAVGALDINLSPVDFSRLGLVSDFNFSGDMEALVNRLRKGAQKRHAKTLLHDRIIKDLAEQFVAQGAIVKADANSIDLFSVWPDGGSAMFEVKTVTRRSLQGRLRTAVGQIQEYAYRHAKLGAGEVDRVVVLNAALTEVDWQTDFLGRHLNIGLICKTPSKSIAFGSDSLSTKKYWG